MPLVVADRVRETTTTTGTGTITLTGAVTGYQSFSAIGNGNTTYYTINAGSQWEVGIGTYLGTGPTLSRDTVLESSNSGSLVNFSAGTKDVFVTYPAEKSISDGYGLLPVANGGTGVTASSGANSVVLRNADQNFAVNNINFGFTSIATAAGTTTLTAASTYTINFTGTTTQTVVMPVTSTLVLGSSFFLRNNSTGGNITVNSSGGNLIAIIIPGTSILVTCIDIVVTTAAGWDFAYTDYQTNTGTGNNVLSANAAFTGTATFVGITASSSIATSSTAAISFIGTGLITIGATTGTNAITVGQSTGAQTLNLATGATLTATTKAVNIGTNGVAGSTTNITIGSTTGTSTTTLNGNTNTGPTLIIGVGVSTGGCGIEVGGLRSGDGTAFIDLHGVAGTDFETRVIRNGGTNGSFSITNLGTGSVTLASGGDTIFSTAGVERMRINSVGAISLAAPLGVANGGTGTTTAFTAGSVVFAGTSGVYSQDNANLFWDNASDRLGIGTTAPGYRLDVASGDTSAGIGYAMRLRSNATATAAAIQFTNSTVSTENGLITCNDAGFITIQGSSAMVFRTNGAERMRIASDGAVAIGLSTPNATLHLEGIKGGNGRMTQSSPKGTSQDNLNLIASTNGGGSDQLFSYGVKSANYFFVQNGVASGDSGLVVKSNNKVIVGTSTEFDATVAASFAAYAETTSAAAFKVNSASTTLVSFYDSTQSNRVGWIGSNSSTTQYNTTSDRRLKKDIQPAADCGDKIDQIEVVSHGWINGTDAIIPYSFIAQDLYEAAPHAVSKGDDGEEVSVEWAVDYSKLVPMLVKEVQSLRARVAQLEGN